MSQLEVSQNSPIFSFTFPAMIAGIVTNASAIPNFAGGCSKILGCVRVTAGGAVGQPYLFRETVGLFPAITLSSGSGTDTSVYRIYWTNELAQSQIASVLGC